MNTTLFYLRYAITGLLAILECWHGRPIIALGVFVVSNWAWTIAEDRANTRWNKKQTQRWLQSQQQEQE